MTAVVLRLHETVEAAVIHIGELIAERLGLTLQPVHVTLSDFLNLGSGQLCLFCILHLDFVVVVGIDIMTILVTQILHHLRCGVVQGMCQQIHAVETLSCLTAHAVLRPNLLVVIVGTDGVLVNLRLVLYRYFHLAGPIAVVLIVGHREKLRGKLAIHIGIHPALTEVKVKLLEGDRLRHCLSQCLK